MSVSFVSNAQQPMKLEDFIEIQSASGSLPAIVHENVNVRVKPDKSSSKIGLLRGGETISAEFIIDSNWAKIRFKNTDAFVHKSALIKQLYRADIKHSTKENLSSVFSMTGWHYSYLPGSYFINYQSNKYGQASFGPLNGSGYTSIDSKLYKLKYPKRDVYFTTTHESGNRTYYSPYIAVPNLKELVIFQLPTISQGDFNRIDLNGDTLSISGRVYNNCCLYDHFDLEINLSTLNYKGEGSYNDENIEGKVTSKPLKLSIKKLELVKNN